MRKEEERGGGGVKNVPIQLFLSQFHTRTHNISHTQDRERDRGLNQLDQMKKEKRRKEKREESAG